MARFGIGFCLLVGIVSLAFGENNKPSTSLDPPNPARTVYLTSPSGDELGMFPLPEDKEALVATRRAIKEGQQFSFVYERAKADIIVVVKSRGTGDTVQVFDSNSPTKSLWHLGAKNGFRGADVPLLKALVIELSTGQ